MSNKKEKLINEAAILQRQITRSQNKLNQLYVAIGRLEIEGKNSGTVGEEDLPQGGGA